MLQTTISELSSRKAEAEMMKKIFEDLLSEKSEQIRIMSAQLDQVAFYASHRLRAPVATLLGLNNILQLEKTTEEKERIFSLVNRAAMDLDEVVRAIQKSTQ